MGVLSGLALGLATRGSSSRVTTIVDVPVHVTGRRRPTAGLLRPPAPAAPATAGLSGLLRSTPMASSHRGLPALELCGPSGGLAAAFPLTAAALAKHSRIALAPGGRSCGLAARHAWVGRVNLICWLAGRHCSHTPPAPHNSPPSVDDGAHHQAWGSWSVRRPPCDSSPSTGSHAPCIIPRYPPPQQP